MINTNKKNHFYLSQTCRLHVFSIYHETSEVQKKVRNFDFQAIESNKFTYVPETKKTDKIYETWFLKKLYISQWRPVCPEQKETGDINFGGCPSLLPQENLQSDNSGRRKAAGAKEPSLFQEMELRV